MRPSYRDEARHDRHPRPFLPPQRRRMGGARFLVARGVNRIFGLQGGHIQPIWDHLAQLGVRIVDVRDEGAAVHMAHAHAALSGQVGVCWPPPARA